MDSFLQKTFNGQKFVQDKNTNYYKINCLFGLSEKFVYKAGVTNDISKVLADAYALDFITVVSYNWTTNFYVLSKGFDVLNPEDTNTNVTGFTSFFVAKNIAKYVTPVTAPVTPPVTTPITTPVTAPVTPPVKSSTLFAPYVDTTLWPPYDIQGHMDATGQKFFTLAFVVALNGKPSWGGYYSMPETTWFLDKVKSIRASGGDVIMSFGGASGLELAQAITDINELVKMYQLVIDLYSLKYVDFDIEGGAIAEPSSVDRRNKALVILKKNNPNLKIHYTLPVMPDGLDFNGIKVIENAKANSTPIDLVNIMCMNMSPSITKMGEATISAGKSLRTQLIANGYQSTKVGLCPMIGVNDIVQEVFTVEDSKLVLKFSQETDYIGLLSFWSCNRDTEQAEKTDKAIATKSGLVQQKYEFAKIFNKFTNVIASVPVVVAPTVPGVVTPTVPAVVTPTPVPVVVTPTVPVVVTPTIPVTRAQKLQQFLKKSPIGAYFESWGSKWSANGQNLDMSSVTNVNIIYISFVHPNCNYNLGQNNFVGTGVGFSSDFAVVKESIKILQSRGVLVILSVGGATYPFSVYNARGVANLCKDLNCNGVDIDYEDTNWQNNKANFGKIINDTRQALGESLFICSAVFSVGAYGEGPFANSPPGSSHTGMCLAGLKSNGTQLDWLNIMSYDAGTVFNPIESFNAYATYFKGPLCIGGEVPPEAWGGKIIKLADVKKEAEYAKSKGPQHGYFVWSYNKQGTPNCQDIVKTAASVLWTGLSSVITPVIPTPTPVTTVTPVPVAATGTVAWSGNSVNYTTNQKVSFGGLIYRCVQGHLSQADWTPSVVLSLWERS